ncbi:MAG: DUF2236 domain-containing protein [Polyangiaceae bacterium]|nr:DUF2236 domain-containing protein [Polyangiaceae bacterium]
MKLRDPAAVTPPDEVTRDALEEHLARLCASVADPAEGLFGPGSKFWEVSGDASCFLGAGRAALLQLAHPHVAWAIQHHSKTRNDPLGRFQRTFFHVFRMIFGDLDAVLRAARAVHNIHARITGVIESAAGPQPAGTPYRANVPDALLWVHATLIHTSVLCHEAIVRPLTAAEKAIYYDESRCFASLFGIPAAVLPPDWPSFNDYVARTLESDALVVTPPAAQMARFLFAPPFPGAGRLMRGYAELTAWLLPARLAEGFGLDRGGAGGYRRHEARLALLRALWPHLPARLRKVPPYIEAQRRVSGQIGRDPLGELLSRLWIGRPSVDAL